MSRIGTKPPPPNSELVLANLRNKAYKTRGIAKAQVTKALKNPKLEPKTRDLLSYELNVRYPDPHAESLPVSLPGVQGCPPVIPDLELQELRREVGSLKEQYAALGMGAEALKRLIYSLRSELEGLNLKNRKREKEPEAMQNITVYVTGPSSSGKSTLIQLLSELLVQHHINFSNAMTDTEHLAEPVKQRDRLRAVARKTHVTLVEKPMGNDPGFCEATRRAMRVPGVGW
jgi:hypothetical protein